MYSTHIVTGSENNSDTGRIDHIQMIDKFYTIEVQWVLRRKEV